MVLVDSSVWIQYLSPHITAVDRALERLIRPSNQIVITGIIFQEVLQGIRNNRSYQLTQKLMGRLPFLIPNPNTHLLASDIFRTVHSKSRIAQTTVDVLIAALSIENGTYLFTQDQDFKVIGKYFPLKLFH